ncbi:NAD(P)-binding protein [Lepidopterella palustris CBS 459.81]|uniref:NAD(P)-binding protein n=1 Tax=Lepidopterella palustris CBS 459.81 TaxID=1314670 RepID=A0A8E2JC03_9PEZI|nr:NAD(P)-binding protein [Lepidopterella palustris CBS 459.81]
MAQTNRIEKVAIVGASGRLGKHFAEELLKTGKHTVTAVTRTDSKGTLPAGVKVAQVNYDDDGQSLVSALQGQQFLIITLSIRAPPDTHSKLVRAAAKAGVPYIMPNAYGFDILNKSLREEDLYGATSLQHCVEIEKLGISYVAMVCGFWYEWSLALGEFWFGLDIKNKKATFFDDGETRVNVSTWRQCGRALAALLSLPESGASPSVSQWKNMPFYFASFRVSQRDMLDSIHRVTGTTDKDWEITYEPTGERYKNGIDEMQKGARTGFAKAMYSRLFFPNGDGDFESSRGLANDLIGLPKEDLDEATKRTVEMVESGWNPLAQ